MSLATRCTACGTIFRVVQDQLRVSEGWVRCGRCAEVFDAREQLFDIDLETPPPWPGDEAEEEAVAPSPPPPPPVLKPDPPAPVPAPSPASQQAETWVELDPQPAPVPAREAPVEIHADSRLDSRIEPQWLDEPPAPAPVEREQQGIEPQAIAMDTGPDVVLTPRLAEMTAAPKGEEPAAAPVQPLPEFMRRANDRLRWQRPGVRIALGAGSLLLLTVLGLQIAHHFNEALLALHPQARPALQALCNVSGCELQPWRRIDAVSVEGTALSQAGNANQYQLNLSLRNKSAVEVALPWVELNLTDMAGTVVLRRMLAPNEFKTDKPLPPKPGLAPGAELPLQLLFSTGDQRVAGYSVEIFHP